MAFLLSFLLSMGLTIVFRSIQAESGSLSEQQVSKSEAPGQLKNQGELRT